MSLDSTNYLTLAIEASILAGDEILEVYATDFNVETKEDNSPVTLADKRAHDKILSHLKPASIPVLSEEGAGIPYEERKHWDRLWIVDPLDGTKEFVKRNDEFTVNIALVENGIPLLGVIWAPVLRVLYYGVAGMGSFKRSDIEGKTEEVKLPYVNQKRIFTVAASKSHRNSKTNSFLDQLWEEKGRIEVISAGSSLKFGLVAEGSADLYARFGPTMEWDTAAGQAIAEAAGKGVYEIETGTPLKYNKAELVNPDFLVK